MKSWHYSGIAFLTLITWWNIIPQDIRQAIEHYGYAWILLCILAVTFFAMVARND